jgi:hypothetical protein
LTPIAAAFVLGCVLVYSLGFLSAGELTKQEVRILLRAMQLPETLNPDAMGVTYNSDDGIADLQMRIRVKGIQADELIGAWLKDVSRVSSGDVRERKDAWERHAHLTTAEAAPLQDDDVLVSKRLEEDWDVHFVLRKRNTTTDIYCGLWYAPPTHAFQKKCEP